MTQFRKSDANIQPDVLNELAWDTRIEQTDVGVEVDQGVVTLTGTVSAWAKKVAAQKAAHRVIGVHDVANDIEVKWSGSVERNDTDIAKAVRHTLEWDVFVPDSTIQSTVSRGVVTLEGEVDNGSQRDAALRAVRNLGGVTMVSDEITLKATAKPADVRKSIEDALKRRSMRDAKDIGLSLTGGTATLSGVVHSWAERETVDWAARLTPGVQRVENLLRIEPYG